MRRFPVIAASVLIAAGLVSGCSASVSVGDTSPAPATSGSTSGVELTETLSNSDYGFSFKYAAPFEPQDDTSFAGEGGGDSSTTSAVFDTKGAQIGGQYRDAFVVNVYPLNAEITDADLPAAKAELENTVIPELKASTPGMQISELTEGSLAGKTAYVADVSFDVEGQPIKSTMYFVFSGSTEYQVLVQAAAKNWDGLQPTFDAMLDSFTITPAASPSAG